MLFVSYSDFFVTSFVLLATCLLICNLEMFVFVFAVSQLNVH